MKHTCDTCQERRFGQSGCAVLKEPIGKDKDCFAWSDDPRWEKKVEKAVKAYMKG